MEDNECPICYDRVGRHGEYSVEFPDGAEFYFCSRHCREMYIGSHRRDVTRIPDEDGYEPPEVAEALDRLERRRAEREAKAKHDGAIAESKRAQTPELDELDAALDELKREP
jgi:YHS domain-containing protein